MDNQGHQHFGYTEQETINASRWAFVEVQPKIKVGQTTKLVSTSQENKELKLVIAFESRPGNSEQSPPNISQSATND